MNKWFYVIVIFCAFAACAPDDKKLPKDIMPVNTMKPIVWDLIQAGAYASSVAEKDTSIKTVNTASLAQVLKMHRLKKEDFFKSFNYYQAHPALNKELFDSVSAYAQRQRNDMYKKLQ